MRLSHPQATPVKITKKYAGKPRFAKCADGVDFLGCHKIFSTKAATEKDFAKLMPT
ncbi:hypothetical protein [Flavisolibacter nicotianae]|uniref:hypothetical protein n=1 Tax=Flavisolibacter nicotianae TaxID=2364882 RepID=UPI0013C43A69|nr:hypothetical protein [Flavisolibacter nicotianae]